MIFHSKLFGEITIKESEIFEFPSGVIGFKDLKKFFFLKVVNDNIPFPLEVMHSFDKDNVAFFVADPYYIAPNFSILAKPEEIQELGQGDIVDIVLRVILRFEGGKIFANFLAPFVINTRTKKGKHLILEGSDDLLDVEIEIKENEKQERKESNLSPYLAEKVSR
jgi:flagellar assembly factor FliW